MCLSDHCAFRGQPVSRDGGQRSTEGDLATQSQRATQEVCALPGPHAACVTVFGITLVKIMLGDDARADGGQAGREWLSGKGSAAPGAWSKLLGRQFCAPPFCPVFMPPSPLLSFSITFYTTYCYILYSNIRLTRYRLLIFHLYSHYTTKSSTFNLTINNQNACHHLLRSPAPRGCCLCKFESPNTAFFDERSANRACPGLFFLFHSLHEPRNLVHQPDKLLWRRHWPALCRN